MRGAGRFDCIYGLEARLSQDIIPLVPTPAKESGAPASHPGRSRERAWLIAPRRSGLLVVWRKPSADKSAAGCEGAGPFVAALTPLSPSRLSAHKCGECGSVAEEPARLPH